MNSQIKELLYVLETDLLFILGYCLCVLGRKISRKRGRRKVEKKGQEKERKRGLQKE